VSFQKILSNQHRKGFFFARTFEKQMLAIHSDGCTRASIFAINFLSIYLFMEKYIKQLEVRWADLDPNFHVLHSRYYDFGAYSRMSFLMENALTPAWMAENHIGMIAFREEAVFKKEILFGDKVTVHLQLLQLNKEVSRWTLLHHLYKNEDVLAAIITIDGAWLDTRLRKLAAAPDRLKEIFLQAPKAENFAWLD